MNMLPCLLTELCSQGDEALVYIARDLSDHLINRLIGSSQCSKVIRTSLPSVPTYQRIARGEVYWPRQVTRDRLDLLHTAYYPVPRLETPVVLTVNDVRFVHLPNTYTRSRLLFLRLFVPFALKQATRIITISQNTKDDLFRYFGVSKSKVDVAHISVGPEFHPIQDSVELERVRLKYHLPDRFILYVGHLEPRKNLNRLVQAFGRLHRQFAQHLVILGKPSFGFQSTLKQVAQDGLAARVLFTGYVEDADMPAIYTQADLLVFPSLHEGFGMPVLEAMACGTPVVTSNGSALPEVAGEAAILVDPYDVNSIAEGITSVLSDPHSGQHLIELGFERTRLFTAKRTVAAITGAYRKALA